ncbi:Type II secretion system F domain protein [Halorubrum coriense DSM 10284]|uniref:Type II secretion system F domain protein n=1 Tax=Halorubrum coriense DSM 10284 TaxID=1227466 RepID=M0EAV0_9EURY|nr:type II secretion system F family protein [Halorubrum coriense]ELZ44178.1 Type II secretion system F domain protein [Halorubrum coriense DSM 10284]
MNAADVVDGFGLSRVYEFFWSRYRRGGEEYAELQGALNAAQLPVTAETYLARSATLSVGFGVVGAVAGVFVGAMLSLGGVVAALDAPPALHPIAVPLAGAEPIGSILVTATVLGGGLGFAYRRYSLSRPQAIADRRGRAIDLNLPNGILFMYALSQGGMDTLSVFRTLAESDDAYGELGSEFRVLIRDVDVFNKNLLDALRAARTRTPSRRFARFVDDAVSIIDSGGDFTSLVETEANTYLQEARAEQRGLIETLALVAEGYISLLVAGPLFLLVLLLVMALLGAETLLYVAAVVYVGIPLGSVACVLLIDRIAGPFEATSASISVDEAAGVRPPAGDARIARYARRKRVGTVRGWLRNPVQTLIDEPRLTLPITVPVAVGLVGAVALSGPALFSASGLTARPIAGSIAVFVLPVLVVAAPVSLFHELRRRQRSELMNRFPETLSAIANINGIGLSLPESIDITSDRRSDRLGEQLGRLTNDIAWNRDTSGALARFANRIGIGEITQSTKLLSEANRAGGGMRRALSIAADDARASRQLRRERTQELQSYLAIVVVGFVVFVGVVAMIDLFYLQGIAQTASDSVPDRRATGLAVSLREFEVNTFRLLVFHAALIQAGFSGLVGGKIANNDVLSGLKISLALVVATVLLFLGV